MSFATMSKDTTSHGTHTVSIDWGDGPVESGVVTQPFSPGTVSDLHVHDDSVYTVTVTGTEGIEHSRSNNCVVDREQRLSYCKRRPRPDGGGRGGRRPGLPLSTPPESSSYMWTCQ